MLRNTLRMINQQDQWFNQLRRGLELVEQDSRAAARGDLAGDQVAPAARLPHRQERASVLDWECAPAEPVADDEARLAAASHPAGDRRAHAHRRAYSTGRVPSYVHRSSSAATSDRRQYDLRSPGR